MGLPGKLPVTFARTVVRAPSASAASGSVVNEYFAVAPAFHAAMAARPLYS
jgi:hypothetical protein